MKEESIRYFINCALYCPNTRIAKFVNGSLAFLIILSIAVIPLHFLPNLGIILTYLDIFDRVVVTIFSVEYILRVWSAKKWWKYVFSWEGIVDLVAILPFFITKFAILSDLQSLYIFQQPEVFLLLRILRILKLAKIYEVEHAVVDFTAIKEHGDFLVLPGEKIQRIIQKHPLIFLIELIFPLVFTSLGLAILVFFRANLIAVGFTVLFLFFAVVFFVKAWLDHNYDVIYITNKRVVLQNRELFGSAQNEIAYESITNTMPNAIGFWHWLFGFGNVQIETAGMDGNFLFENAPDPHAIVHTISVNRQSIIDKNKKHHRPSENQNPKVKVI